MMALWSMEIIGRNRLKWKIKEEKDHKATRNKSSWTVLLSAFRSREGKNLSRQIGNPGPDGTLFWYLWAAIKYMYGGVLSCEDMSHYLMDRSELLFCVDW